MTLLYQLINGFQVGSIYALVALGYSMVYGIVKLINFSHGEIIMVGSYCTWIMLVQANTPVWFSILSAIIICTVLGIAIEKIAYKPLRKSARISLLITAIGISMLLQNLALLIFSASPKMFPDIINIEPIIFGNKQIGFTTVVTIVVSVIMMIGLNILKATPHRVAGSVKV